MRTSLSSVFAKSRTGVRFTTPTLLTDSRKPKDVIEAYLKCPPLRVAHSENYVPDGYFPKHVVVIGNVDEIKTSFAPGLEYLEDKTSIRNCVQQVLNSVKEHKSKEVKDIKEESFTVYHNSNRAVVAEEEESTSSTKFTLLVTPDVEVSRTLSKNRPDLLMPLLLSKKLKPDTKVIIAHKEEQAVMNASFALSKALPVFGQKSEANNKQAVKGEGDIMQDNKQIECLFLSHSDIDVQSLGNISYSIQLSQYLTDCPANMLNCDAYEELIRDEISDIPHVTMEVIKGEDLAQREMNGIFSVGMAAAEQPRMVILRHSASENSNVNTMSKCLVGKGIVYDTGGLSLKPSNFMTGMKRDMGGSASCLGAFLAVSKLGGLNDGHDFYTILCLAENSINEKSLRPDDIIKMYSGATCEINNTDAEGRLVLADGVAYAAKHLNPALIITMATLTGAQGIATGDIHAGLYTNDVAVENALLQSSINTGDHLFPLLFAPELHMKHYKTEVADMKNSTTSRACAQSSCAGAFIFEHMKHSGYENKAAHIDMAFPSYHKERATGYGVSLLCHYLFSN